MLYHPQWNLGTGVITGMEALLRWNRPGFGQLMPSTFVPVAEKSGLIIPLGEWAMRLSFTQARAWRHRVGKGFRVAINISGRQLHQPDFLTVVKRLLEETGADPSMVEFEFTESVIMEKAVTTIDILKELKGMGITLSVDDFGTGYSSLSYLKHFPIDRIKIDQSFVAELARDRDDAAIVEAVVSLAHILNLRVLAEGVETEEQVRFLENLGCDEAQGYYMAQPLKAADAACFLEPGYRAGISPLRHREIAGPL